MKLTPYKKLLTMAKDAIDATLAPVRANSAKKKAELEQAKVDAGDSVRLHQKRMAEVAKIETELAEREAAVMTAQVKLAAQEKSVAEREDNFSVREKTSPLI